MISSLHDLDCAGPMRCTCNSIAIRKPTPKVRERKPLRSKPHPILPSVRLWVLEFHRYVCQWCLGKGGALDLHHLKARSAGGRDTVDNLKPVHRKCHRYIHEHPSEARRRGFIVGTGSNQ